MKTPKATVKIMNSFHCENSTNLWRQHSLSPRCYFRSVSKINKEMKTASTFILQNYV